MFHIAHAVVHYFSLEIKSSFCLVEKTQSEIGVSRTFDKVTYSSMLVASQQQ